jgi:glycosyltransferase involved in cell wall biosynthesis
MVSELGLEAVVFAGHVDDDELLAYYSLADVFVCLSEHEGFGVPLVEAMLLGVPVVAYDAGAVADTLQGGGVLLRERDPVAVAEIVEQIVSRSDLRRVVLASQARAMARRRGTEYGRAIQEQLSPVLEKARARGGG